MATVETSLLTVAEVADELRISTNSAYKWIREGRLPAILLGKEWRIRRRDLDAWLSARESTSDSAA